MNAVLWKDYSAPESEKTHNLAFGVHELLYDFSVKDLSVFFVCLLKDSFRVYGAILNTVHDKFVGYVSIRFFYCVHF